MTSNKAGEPAATGKMRPQPVSQPGLEQDGKTDVIPLAERTQQHRAAAIAAGERDVGDKDPEQELEHPAPMPREQQGKGGKGPDRDPEGQQGGYHR
jgi:hypothetical protein